MDKENILLQIEELEAGDFVALVQSSSFRLSDFRIRIELFKKKIKVVEHPHLGRMSEENEVETYVNALAYDKEYYHHMGHTLKAMIERASGAVIHCGDEKLIYPSSFEDAKLNIGDYREMKNMGGQFPIGEVFTELKELRALNGRTKIKAFGDINYKVNIPEQSIIIVIENGQLVGTENSTENFVSDKGTFERMCGLHLSLGAKHGIYVKEGMKRNSGRFHINVMIATDKFTIDEQVVFDGEKWLLLK